VNEEGIEQFVATALVCNISRSTCDKPSLLKHQEVVTLFHELGHGKHFPFFTKSGETEII